MLTKELVCRGFIAAIWKDASDVAGMIADQVSQEGIRPSLDDGTCRNALTAEWFFARLIWLELKAKAISDSELKKFFLDEIATSENEILRLVPDLAGMRVGNASRICCAVHSSLG